MRGKTSIIRQSSTQIAHRYVHKISFTISVNRNILYIDYKEEQNIILTFYPNVIYKSTKVPNQSSMDKKVTTFS